MESSEINVNQLLVLAIISEGVTRISEISRRIGMTRQGALYHIKDLKNGGFVDDENRITKSGYDHLAKGLEGLSNRISSYSTSLHRSQPWETIAEESISKGDRVYLRMRRGYLYSTTNQASGCTGIASNNALESEPCSVTGIQGLIDFDLGKVTILVLPSADAGKKAHDLTERAKGILDELRPDLVGSVGEDGYMTARKLGRIDLEFSANAGAFEAAARGLSSVIFISEGRMRFELSKIEEIARKMPEVRFRIQYL